MAHCVSCGKKISTEVEYCSHCGLKVHEDDEKVIEKDISPKLKYRVMNHHFFTI